MAQNFNNLSSCYLYNSGNSAESLVKIGFAFGINHFIYGKKIDARVNFQGSEAWMLIIVRSD